MLRVIGLLLVLFLVMSCENEKEAAPGGLPTEARRAAEILLDSLVIDSTADIFVVGPLPGGTVLREFVPDSADTAVTLTLPNHSGAVYAFFINDDSHLNWSHAVRYAYVVPDAREVSYVSADWPMFVDRPDGEVAPFSLIAEERIGNAHFHYGSGGGSFHEDLNSGKPVADTLRMTRERVAKSLDAPCKKLGFVFDGGEWSDFWGKEGFSAGAMADNANLASSFLDDNGFTTTRISQYKGNSLPGYFTGGGDLGDQLRNSIRNIASQFECPCDGDPGCHEFFLYICAHGDDEIISIYEPGKEGFAWFKYSDLNNWLNAFPPCVKVIVFLDICESGNARNDLEGQCNTRGDCGFTLITTCDAANGTPSGLGSTDSGTEDWAEGEGEDYDNDGKEGDLGDRWMNLEDENSDYGPTRFMCPGQSGMCSTD